MASHSSTGGRIIPRQLAGAAIGPEHLGPADDRAIHLGAGPLRARSGRGLGQIGVDTVVFDAAEYAEIHPLEWLTVYSCALRGITALDERIFMGKGILAKPGINWP